MRKFTFSFKTLLLLASMLIVGGNCAWAQTWVNDIVLDFDDNETYQLGWTAGGDGITRSQELISGSDYAMKLTGTKSRDYSYDMKDTHVNTDDTWKIEFDWAIAGITGTTHDDAALHFYIYYDTNTSDYSYSYGRFKSVNKLFNYYIAGTAWNNTISFRNASNTEITTFTSVSYKNYSTATWFHTKLVGDKSANKVKMTITKISDSSTFLSETEISSFVNPRGISLICGKAAGVCMINNFKTSFDIAPYKSRATAATTAYTAIKDDVMNSTVKTALESAKGDLDAFDDDDAIAADLSGYISAIEALETANENAQESIDDFKILNNLIGNSKPAGYVAPDGAASVITENSSIDPVVKASEVRAAVITAGTANNNTDISAVIANKSFELGSSLGWTIAPSSDDSGINVTDGVLTINPNGNTVSQTIGTLPAGRYTLSAKAWSNGAKIYLIINNTHNDGAIINGDNQDVTYSFTLTSEQDVTIGINSGDQYNDNAFVSTGGRWWYRCDNFSLTYVDDDPLGRAKAALTEEISDATDVKNAWTPKVGTAPFKYASTYYDDLVTELSEAAVVAASGSETVKEYTDAKDELKAAKEAMASSVLNLPATDKYYRLYLAEDGVSTGKNLKMLEYGNGKAVLSATSYPVKFVSDGEGNYIIENPYDYYVATTREGNSNWGVYKGLTEEDGTVTEEQKPVTMYINANVWSYELQSDGTVKFLSENTTWKGYGWRLGAWSTDENSLVAPYDGTLDKATRDNPTYDTWLCSDAVDLDNVQLYVNATADWGTFIAPYDNLTPSTVSAYTVSYQSDGYLHLTENETGVLSANTPYILHTDEASNVTATFKGIATNEEDTYEVNGLVGMLTAGTVPADSYVMQYQAESGTSFYQTDNNLAGTANRCYLDFSSVPTSAPGAAKAISIRIDGQATEVVAPEVAETEEEEVLYNMAGIQVDKNFKGFVVNQKGVKRFNR